MTHHISNIDSGNQISIGVLIASDAPEAAAVSRAINAENPARIFHPLQSFFFVPIYFNPLLSYLKSGNVITSNFELIEARGGENEPLENHQFNQTQKRLANIELTAIVERCRRLRRRFDSRPPVGAPPDGRIPVHFSMDRLFNSEGIYLHLEWFQCFNVFVVPPQIQFSLKIGFIGN